MDRIRSRLGALWKGALDWLYPPRCVGCGSGGVWLCRQCVEAVPGLANPGFAEAADGSAAGRLPVYSVGPHQGALRKAVHQLKYEGVRVLAEPMAALMAELPLPVAVGVDCMMPVPLFPGRQRFRGYNQSRLLAERLGERMGIAVEAAGLRRLRNTPSQVGLGIPERRLNVQGAFQAESMPAGLRVVLVDDVCTSGATLSACAAALGQQGARVVFAVTFTRAMGPSNDV